MEGKRQIIEDVLSLVFVVLSHCVEKCLFVSNDKVLTHMVVDLDILGIDLSKFFSFEVLIPFGHILIHF